MQDLRCKKCRKLLVKYHDCKQLEIKCPRCGELNMLQEQLSRDTQTPSLSAIAVQSR